MIVVIGQIEVLQGQQQGVEEQLRMLVEYVRNEEPGTLTYVIHRGTNDPGRYLLYERYIDEKALSKHVGSARVQQVFDRILPLLQGPPVIQTYEEVAGKR